MRVWAPARETRGTSVAPRCQVPNSGGHAGLAPTAQAARRAPLFCQSTTSSRLSDRMLAPSLQQLCASRPRRSCPPTRASAKRGDMSAQAAPASASPSAAVRGSDFIRPHLKTMAPYTPIEPFEVLSERLGRAPKDIIKLDANENPYGPPPGELRRCDIGIRAGPRARSLCAQTCPWVHITQPPCRLARAPICRGGHSDGIEPLRPWLRFILAEVAQELAKLEFPHIYPDPEARRLRAALAEDCGVPAQNLMAGACDRHGRMTQLRCAHSAASLRSGCCLHAVRSCRQKPKLASRLTSRASTVPPMRRRPAGRPPVLPRETGSGAERITIHTDSLSRVTGCGADELIDILMRCVLGAPDNPLADTPPPRAAAERCRPARAPRLRPSRTRRASPHPSVVPRDRARTRACSLHDLRRSLTHALSSGGDDPQSPATASSTARPPSGCTPSTLT